MGEVFLNGNRSLTRLKLQKNMIIIWASLVAQMVKNLPAMRETRVPSLDWEDLWRREWLPTPVFLSGEFRGWGAWRTLLHDVAKSRTQMSG